MKGMMVRGVAGLAVALGLAACTNDDTVNAGGDFDKVQANPATLFVSIGDSSEVLVRLVDDLNRSTPTKFTVSNVGAGIAVNYDPRYRPDYTQGDTLVVPEIKPQQRYYVVGTANGLHEFTLTSGGASTTVRVYVTPDNLGAALSRTTGVAGDQLVITAPPGTRFNANSVVTFASGPAPAITARAADGSTITMLIGPGVGGAVTVTNITYLFAPAAPAVTLVSTTTITTPAVTQIPIAIAPGAPAALQQVTVTAPGFKFLPSFAVTVGGFSALVISRAADSLSAQVVFPAAPGAVVVSGVALSFLPSVTLNGLTPAAALSLPTTTPWAGANPDAAAAVLTANAPGTPLVFRDTWRNAGADILGLGGPARWYRLVIPSAGTRTYTVAWNNTADIDFVVCNDALTSCPVQRLTGANPEVGSTNLAPGNYWINLALYAGAAPGIVTITVN